jgi:uncharacterized membrane protein YagU involved in acid resistance
MSSEDKQAKTIPMPAPTAWPMVLAAAIAMILAGLVTNGYVSFIGGLLLMVAAIGWWCEVLPNEHLHEVPLEREPDAAMHATSRRVEKMRLGQEGHRVHIPAEIKPYSSGIKGGLVGAAAMAGVALVFGLISQGSIWYPINLLAGAALPEMATASMEKLRQFNALALVLGTVVHLLTSILVGLLYAVMLPMFPKRAWLWAGWLAPILWTGLIASTLDVVNPALNKRIDWRWFIASQLAFGVIGGYVIARSQSIETMQSWPLAARAGIEAPREMDGRKDQ